MAQHPPRAGERPAKPMPQASRETHENSQKIELFQSLKSKIATNLEVPATALPQQSTDVADWSVAFRQFLNSLAYRQLTNWSIQCERKMTEAFRPRVKYVIGPDGSPLTLADLPPASTRRWVIRRKAEIVAAVRGGLLSLEEACARYTLTVDEFLSWQASIDRHGLAGLRTTRIQQYRQ